MHMRQKEIALSGILKHLEYVVYSLIIHNLKSLIFIHKVFICTGLTSECHSEFLCLLKRLQPIRPFERFVNTVCSQSLL